MAPTNPPAKIRRFPPLQFSLRVAFLALTAFAVGFPVWYRWPYEEVIEHKSPTGSVGATTTTTWQRQWGGGRRRHGLETRRQDGGLVQTTMYVRGVAHGPYQMTNKGRSEAQGQYEDGMREGTWMYRDRDSTVRVTWRRGKLDGPYERESTKGSSFRHMFSAGRLTEINGQPARNRLYDLLESGVFDADDGRVGEELQTPTKIEFVETPLVDVVVFLQETHNLPMFLDSARVPAPPFPITADYKGIDLISGLTLLTSSHNLGCDYRYGMICITTAKDAEDWRDPTGVAQIEPLKGTALARAWNEPATLEAVYQPLAPQLAMLAQRLAIDIDTSQIDPTGDNPSAFSITANAKGLPFRHILGFALYQTNCRCKLDGDKLIILPPAPGP